MSLFRNSYFIFRGLREFTRQGYEKAAKDFNAKDLDVDLTGKSVIVTGANSGIGKITALEVAKRGGTVHLVCRSRDRAEEAQRDIKEASKNGNVHVHIVDLGRPAQIRKFVSDFTAQGHKAHVLVNNAGCMVNERTLTPEGLEANFATNTLGTYLLTELMLPVLRANAPARVVTVSSGGMYTVGLDTTDLQTEKKHFDGTFVYAQNKRQQVCLTQWWARREGSNPPVSFYSCHPGWADTAAVRSSMPDFHRRMEGRLRTEEQGADTVVWLTACSNINVAPGSFVQDRQAVGLHFPLAFTTNTEQDEDTLVKKLDEILAKLPAEP
eukprot:comp18351_c1_seq1/m.19480 comp18351_c1_seq1/g.19480  ORF comp18351_c1_seq1/g.19480 comp18351_c1_seq1/m.19480 type:complete len:324 (-) comp18351_c1_seq1:43-1014(-)